MIWLTSVPEEKIYNAVIVVLGVESCHGIRRSKRVIQYSYRSPDFRDSNSIDSWPFGV